MTVDRIDRSASGVVRTSWHGSDSDAVLEALGATSEGLSGQEADERLERYGPNEIPQESGPSWAAVLVRQFTSPLIYALGVSAGVALALGRLADGVVVLVVVLANALIGFVQEFRAGRAIQALAQLVAQPATARRDGDWHRLPADELVPGDVVEVAPGERVTADLRVLDGVGLRADESALTGESVPVGKSARPVPVEAGLPDRSSVLHAGTLVSAGSGRGVVVETGGRTELGRISGLMRVAEDTRTPLTRSMARLGTTVTWVIGVVAVILLGIALVRGYPLADAALAAITLAVAAIPEGLPAIVTIALAVGVRRMAARRAIVRELPAVETLGSTAVVCTDKTGTLTRNEMVVRRAWTPADEVAFEGIGYSPEGRVLRAGDPARVDTTVADLLEAAVLANEGRLEGSGEHRHVVGDPTDGALLVAAERGGLSPARARSRIRQGLLPFDSDHQYMAAAYERATGPGVATYVKGAPEVLLAHVPEHEALEARAVLRRYTDEGLRVLAVARREGDDVDADLGRGDGLRLLGLVAMIDPPRAEVVESIAACRAAGVDVKMITGDHPATATAIGRELGIVGTSPALTGPEIAQLSDEELGRRVGSTAVFARVSPEHKLRLVRAVQESGAVTAMTGDGVNDAPALRQADIGVAMGAAGTDVAKEAADIVLGDDNFATIRAAIEEGRRVYDNLVKALAFALPTNVGEGLVILVAVLTFPIVDGQPVLPIEPVQILWLNLVAAVTLALPLAVEAKEPGLMRRPPRDPREPLLSRFVVIRTVYVGILMAAVAIALFVGATVGSGESLVDGRLPDAGVLAEAQTLAVTALAFFQIFYLLLCRTLKQPVREIGWWSNPQVFVGIGILLVLQVGFVHLPVMQGLFRTAALDPAQWVLAALGGAVVVPVVMIEKAFRRRADARA